MPELALPTTNADAGTRPGIIGLVAGWGRYPIVVAEALKRQGYQVCCLGIKDHVDPRLSDICDEYREFGIAKLGAHLRYFRRNHVHHAMMAGKVFKNRILYRRFGWISHLPDWVCIRTFYPHFYAKTSDRKDDTLLGALTDVGAKYGVTFVPATDFAPELLVKAGTLTKRQLTPSQQKDIEFGWRLAKEMGRLDVGQSAAVKGQAVLAIEAIEGTDECIRRAGSLCRQGGFTVVKVAKPNQDMRFDVPTIGVGTLETMIEANCKVLAIEADKTIILDESEVIEFANRHKLTLVALDADSVAKFAAA